MIIKCKECERLITQSEAYQRGHSAGVRAELKRTIDLFDKLKEEHKEARKSIIAEAMDRLG